MALPRLRAPLWFHVGLAVVSALALRVFVCAHGGGDTAPGQAPPVSKAFFAFLILIGELIWKGLEVAGRVTLEVLHWMVVNLSLVVTKIKNGLGALGGELLKGLKRGWDFTRALYDDVLKPAWLKFWRWFDKFRSWMDRTFGPVLRYLKKVRDAFLLFYKTWIRPWLDLLDVTRKLMRVLASMGLDWAHSLDAWIGKLEQQIEAPFRFVLSKINEVIGIVNRIVTVDGLLQRATLIRSIARDYQYAWRAIANPWTKLLSGDDKQKLKDALAPKTLATISADLRTYLRDRSGPDAPVLDEMTLIARAYLRSR